MRNEDQKPAPDKPGRPAHGELTALTALGLVGTLGFLVALPIVGGVLLGAVLDRLAGGGGLILLGGVLAGVAAGIYGAYRVIMREIPWKR